MSSWERVVISRTNLRDAGGVGGGWGFSVTVEEQLLGQLTDYQRANVHSTVRGMVTLAEPRFLLRTPFNL